MDSKQFLSGEQVYEAMQLNPLAQQLSYQDQAEIIAKRLNVLLADALAANEERVRRETLEFLNKLPVRTSLGDAIRALADKG